MKKYSEKHRKFLLKKSKAIKRKSKVPKGQNTKQFRAYKRLHDQYREKLVLWDAQRKAFYLEFYKPIEHIEASKKITVDQPIGAEKDIKYLAEIGYALINGSYQETHIDISKCTRVWPSGVMAFCSFRHWSDLTAPEAGRAPRVSSSDSDYEDVSAYLDFCGFHNYVKRRTSGKNHDYVDQNVVKIQREPSGKSFWNRFDEIAALLEKNTDYDSDELEDFKSHILTEILINVTEHGINYRDMGWYTLVQVHPASGIISLNIADNGIGIANSLKTGPQKTDLNSDQDHLYILEAFKFDVSGAFSASTEKKGIFKKQYARGNRRGNGLMHIKEACQRLGVRLSLMSAKGYVQYDEMGQCVAKQSYEGLIFAGTLYNLTIPIKRTKHEN